MRQGTLESAINVRERVRMSRTSIYDAPIDEGDPLFYTPAELELILNNELVGSDELSDLPIRTRSKLAKGMVCEALGYAVPGSFKKAQPRFPHPNFDLYVQQSNNLQIWNSEVDVSRRYVLLLLDSDGLIARVRVLAGAEVAKFDKTGKATTKYQANRIDGMAPSRLVSGRDTNNLISELSPVEELHTDVSPVTPPKAGEILTIAAIYRKLLPLVGEAFPNLGATQERNRGSLVHRNVCEALGLSHYADNGQFPDVLSQALEVKLQLARTVDLGLVLPNSEIPIASANNVLSAADVRYAIFYGSASGDYFTLDKLVLSTGAGFFREFRQFEGNVRNEKYQLRLPSHWFSLA